jgi:hypothetical protein
LRTSASKSGVRSARQGVIRAGRTPENTFVLIGFVSQVRHGGAMPVVTGVSVIRYEL